MLERLVENWLTKVNEKSFQVPFCQMLTAEGYRVVHLTRHGSFEEGKDILAIAPDGVPCAFQLKGSSGKITQRKWAQYIDQVNRLVEIPIKHPSINETQPRRVYFVTNAEFEEEVRVEISNRNADWRQRGHPELNTIVKGELLSRFTAIHDKLWPLPIVSERVLLELYLSDGTGYLDKPKFASFLEDLLFNTSGNTKAEIARNLAGLAIFTAYLLTPFSILDNHVALIEGWMIYLACLIAYAEKTGSSERKWGDSFTLATYAVETSLSDLCKELKEAKHYVPGNPLVDAPFYRGRLTWLVSLTCVYILWEKRRKNQLKLNAWEKNFILTNLGRLQLWGEAAVPQFLAIIWCIGSMGVGHLGDQLLFEVLKAIVEMNFTGQGISDPYHPLGEVIMTKIGFANVLQRENFKGRTYTLFTLIQLIVRRGWRGALSELWKPITYQHFVEFEPQITWQYCLWHLDNGTLHDSAPNSTQSWSELQEFSLKVDLSKLPRIFQANPDLLLLFLIVYPHRIRPDVVKFLDDVYQQIGI